MMRTLTVLLLFLAACSPQQRYAHLIKSHPELLQVADTVYEEKTYVVVDTFIIEADTVEIENVDTFIDTEYQTIYVTRDKIKIVDKPRTIIKEKIVKVQVPTIRARPVVVKEIPLWCWIAICLLATFVLLLLFKPKPK